MNTYHRFSNETYRQWPGPSKAQHIEGDGTDMDTQELKRTKWSAIQYEIVSDMAIRIRTLENCLRNLVDVNERIGPPPIQQGGLCEEEDWNYAMRISKKQLDPKQRYEHGPINNQQGENQWQPKP